MWNGLDNKLDIVINGTLAYHITSVSIIPFQRQQIKLLIGEPQNTDHHCPQHAEYRFTGYLKNFYVYKAILDIQDLKYLYFEEYDNISSDKLLLSWNEIYSSWKSQIS